MSEININNNKTNSNKINNKTGSPNSYHSLHLKKKESEKSKGSSLLSKLKILLEFSFLILTFALTLRKAIKIVMKNKRSNIEENNNISKYQNIKKIKKQLKVCICTKGRKDNRYIKEFVQFYEKWGVNKIFLYDINDKNGERFEEIINDYINKGFVEVFDWRGKNNEVLNLMNDCYQKYNQQYDWLLFYDIDEYIHLNNYTNIKKFLNEDRFDNCQKIYLNWVFHTDNYLFHYENKTLEERFPEKESKPLSIKNDSINYVKSIIRGNLTNMTINSEYILSSKINGCNGFGKEPNFIGYNMEEVDFENYYIDHYFYKTVDEFIEKLKSKDYNDEFKNKTIRKYFECNELAYERIVYIESRTGLNLSEYHNKLKEINERNDKNKY